MGNTEFQIETYKTDDQIYPSVLDLSDSGFVAPWHSKGQDGDGYDSYGQRYDLLASGRPIGSEFPMHTYTASRQSYPSVTSMSDGGFAVAWASNHQDASGIVGQRCDKESKIAGSDFNINTTSEQYCPSITTLSDLSLKK
jgi:hypothetical protein